MTQRHVIRQCAIIFHLGIRSDKEVGPQNSCQKLLDRTRLFPFLGDVASSATAKQFVSNSFVFPWARPWSMSSKMQHGKKTSGLLRGMILLGIYIGSVHYIG